jgi:hypothetical protein
MDTLRSFKERLRNLRDENPHASEANLREAVKGAVQVMIARSREQRQRLGTQRVTAESETPREVLRLPEVRREARHDIAGPPSGRMQRGAESEVEQMHSYISRIDHPCCQGTVQVHPCLPGDYWPCHFPGVVRACSSPGEIGTTHLREATVEPCRGSLRQATGRGSPPHR